MSDQPNIASLSSLSPLPPADLAHLPSTVRATLEIREREKRGFLEARARGRTNPDRFRLGTSPLPPLPDTRIKSWDGAGDQGDWRGVIMGTGGKRRLWSPT